MRTYPVAKTISSLFDPLLLSIAAAALFVLKSGFPAHVVAAYAAAIVCFVLLPPVCYLVWCVRSGTVSNWDMSVRSERVRVFVVFAFIFLIDLVALRLFGPATAFPPAMFFFIWFAGFFALTLLDKLSGHTGTLTLVAGLCVRWFGSSWLPLFIIVPLVAWSRVVLKRHTLLQTVAGTAYSLSILGMGAALGMLP